MDVVFHPIFLEHKAAGHPEGPGRLAAVLDWIKETGINVLKPKNGEQYLGLAHSQEYIDYVKGHGPGRLDLDTYVNEKSYEAACYAAGGAVLAAEKNAFVLARPPGHHATRSEAGGFCIFNNIAIASLHLQKKVFIIDFDAHHGNGTQDIVLHNPNVMYFSTHQSPHYPGTGLESTGNCINIPLKAGTGDEGYIKILEEKLQPAIEKFEPDVIAVSAGFDSYYKDASWLTDLKLTGKSYQKVCEIIDGYRCFFVLEGGYNPESVKEGVETILSYLK